MPHIAERSEQYFPQIIEATDREGRTVVRASRHQTSREWTVTINTAPRSLPDLHLVGNSEDITMVRNLVELLAEAIETRGWMPTYRTNARVRHHFPVSALEPLICNCGDYWPHRKPPPPGCYTGECHPGDKCIWGCSLWNHWADNQ